MSNTSTTTNQPVIAQLIAVSKLEKSPLNVRKTVSKAACDEMKASIVSHGLMQNLVVTAGKKGNFLVIAGGRRLEAIKALIAEGNLPDDHAVPCQIVSTEHGAEMSLAENVVRLAMHPADQFEAFADLIEKGNTAEQVSKRFGVTRKLVEGRMKLARLAPELIQAYREEKLTLEALMAFTVTDDHQKQIAVYESINTWDEADDIRAALTEEMVEAKSKLVAFVTLETYQAAGGTTKTDLFGDDVYLENPELLEALVTEKLKLVEQELKAEGWGWAQVDMERDWQATQGCGRIEAEPVGAPEELLGQKNKIEQQLNSIEEYFENASDDLEDDVEETEQRQEKLEEELSSIESKLEAYLKYSPDKMATAGCYAYIGREGELEVEKGLVKREDAKKAGKALDDDSEDGGQPAEKPKGIPESLKRDLEAYRLGVAQVEIAKHPAIAFDLLVFKAAKSVLAVRPSYDGPNVSFNREFGGNTSKDARDFIREQMEPVAKALPTGWLKADSEAEQFTAFQKLTVEQKHALLAYCVACTLQPKLGQADEDRLTAYDVALSQTGANVADYWRPTKDNFLSRITKDQLLAIGRDGSHANNDHWLSKFSNAKKSAIVEDLHAAFAIPKGGNVRDDILQWLPAGMAFGTALEPKPAKAKKSKKAA